MRTPFHLIDVTTPEDSLEPSSGSLRAAVEAANGDKPGDGCSGTSCRHVIRLPHGTYRLTDAPLVVSGDLTILGDPAQNGASVVLSGCATTNVITVTKCAHLTLVGVTVTGGGGAMGAGILNRGILTVRRSTLRNNTATGESGANSPCLSTPERDQDCAGGGGGGAAGLGGGLFNTGHATLESVVLRSNAAVGGAGGNSSYPMSGQFCDTGGPGGGPEGGAGGGYTDCSGSGTAGGAGGFASGGGGGGAAAFGGGDGGAGGFGAGGGGGGGRTSGGANSTGGVGGFGGGSGATPFEQSAGGGGGGGGGIGGAIFNKGGFVRLTGCRFDDNRVSGGAPGTGIPAGAAGQGLCPDVFSYGGFVFIDGCMPVMSGCTACDGVIAPG